MVTIRERGAAASLGMEGVADPVKHPLPISVTTLNFVLYHIVWVMGITYRENWGTKFGSAGTPPLGWLNPKNTPSHMCYHAEFGRSRSNTMGIGMGPQKFGGAEPPAPCAGAWLTPGNTPLPT